MSQKTPRKDHLFWHQRAAKAMSLIPDFFHSSCHDGVQKKKTLLKLMVEKKLTTINPFRCKTIAVYSLLSTRERFWENGRVSDTIVFNPRVAQNELPHPNLNWIFHYLWDSEIFSSRVYLLDIMKKAPSLRWEPEKILKKSVFNFEIDGLVVNIVLTEKQDQIRVPRLYFWKKLIKK